MLHCDRTLALRLERSAAEIGREAATVHRRLFVDSAASAIEIAGGLAVFIEATAPLTQVRGAGMGECVSESEIERAEQFCRERDVPVSFVLSPFADPALFTYLSRRGYEIGEFQNTLVRKLAPEDAFSEPDVQPATDEMEWAEALTVGFMEQATPGGIRMSRALYGIPACRNYIVRAEASPAAVAQLDLRNGIATLQCDATLRQFRDCGLQKMLIHARLAAALEAGCEFATCDVAPGSISQQNYEKLGFVVAYTRMTLVSTESFESGAE